MFDSSDRLSDRSDEAFTRHDRRTDQSDRPVGPTGQSLQRRRYYNQLAGHIDLIAAMAAKSMVETLRGLGHRIRFEH